MYGRIMRCGIVSSCQSAATSEIVKRFWACVHRAAALYQVPDLYLCCSPMWCPYTIGLIKRVESVQKVFTKKLPGMRYLSYKERLSVLNLQSLEVRRLKIDLVTCFKILKGLTSITPTELFTLSGSSTRGHSLKLYCPDSRINIRAHFFAVRVIHVWNRLPPHMVALDDVKSFARGLDSLSSKFFSTRYWTSYCEFLGYITVFMFLCCGRL